MLQKTNKEVIEPDFPAYITDFSPGRDDALKRDIRASNSRKQADGLPGSTWFAA